MTEEMLEELFAEVVGQLLVLAPELGRSPYDDIVTSECENEPCAVIQLADGTIIQWHTREATWQADVTEPGADRGPNKTLSTVIPSSHSDAKVIAGEIFNATEVYLAGKKS
jgi:hypothetical protein